MNAEEFKEEVKRILESEMRFDGHVTLVIKNISEEKQKSILVWVKEGKQKAEPCRKFKSLVSFIYKSNDNRVRGILTKEKSSYFIELFLDKHKYYDRKRKYLGL